MGGGIKKIRDLTPDSLKEGNPYHSNEQFKRELLMISLINYYLNDKDPNKHNSGYLHRSKPKGIPTILNNKEIVSYVRGNMSDNEFKTLISSIDALLSQVIDLINAKKISSGKLDSRNIRIQKLIEKRKKRP